MTNCFKCATPLPDGARFCGICGSDVSADHSHDTTLSLDRSGDAELMARLQSEVGTEYVIEKELGRGGMAIVYLGHDSQLGRKVAVKLLPPELTFGSDSQVISRFRREARTSATLDHPNIIPVYRVSQGGKLFWYVMKFLDGEPLDRILQREGQLPVARSVEIVRQAAEALDYAHQNQVIHRDVKPANIIVDGKGRVVVTDFGIAKVLDANTLTATGSMIGTPYFMSPEQCAGIRVGPSSDQYSLAVMTYLMLGGQLPFTGDSTFEIVRQHVMEPVPPLGVLRPALDQAVIAAVERGLAKSPDARFASCGEFASSLAAAMIPAIAPAVPAPVPAPNATRVAAVAVAAEQTSPADQARRRAKADAKSRSRRRFAWGGAVAGLAALGVVIVLSPTTPLDGLFRSTPAAPADSSALRNPGASDSLRTTPQQPTSPSTDNASQGIQPVSPSPAGSQSPTPAVGSPASRTESTPVSSVAPPPVTPPPATPSRSQLVNPRSTPTISRPAPEERSPAANRSGAAAPAVDGNRGTTGASPVTLPSTQLPATAPTSGAPAAPTSGAPTATPAAQPSTAPSTAPARITVGSTPQSAMTINGRAVPTNPIRNHEVAPGSVTIVFTVTDSTGVWTVTRHFQVVAGESKNLGRIALVRP